LGPIGLPLSLLLRTGGRPFAYDDIEILQGLALAGNRLFAGLPNCVVSGCELTPSGSNYDIGSGVVWLDGELRDFPGRANVALPALFQLGTEVRSDNRVHTLTSQNLPCAREQNAELVDYDPLNPPSRRPLMLTANGPLMWWHRTEEKRRRTKEILWAADLNPAEYDADGRGVGAAWGWALADGRSGRVDLSGRFITALDATRPDYNTVGKTGGLETVTLLEHQMPIHHHTATVVHEGDDPRGFYGTFVGQQNGAPAGQRTATVNDAGGGQAHENRPPFYVLAAWQWVGFD